MNLNGSIMSEQKLSLRQIEIMRHAIGLGNEKLKSAVDDAMLNFYLEADKDTIAETLQEVGNMDSYKEKRDKLISVIRTKAKTSK